MSGIASPVWCKRTLGAWLKIPPEPPAEILFQNRDGKVDRDGVVARYDGQGRDCASKRVPRFDTGKKSGTTGERLVSCETGCFYM